MDLVAGLLAVFLVWVLLGVIGYALYQARSTPMLASSGMLTKRNVLAYCALVVLSVPVIALVFSLT